MRLQCLAYCGKGGAFRGNSHGAVYHRKDQKEGHRLHFKGGNVFDTCLKFENDQISFDFDNPGEEEVQSTAEVHNNADAQNNADAYNNADTQNNAEVQSTADDAPDKTTMNNTTMDEMGIPEEFLAGFDMAADSAQADDVSEAALAAAHELFGE